MANPPANTVLADNGAVKIEIVGPGPDEWTSKARTGLPRNTDIFFFGGNLLNIAGDHRSFAVDLRFTPAEGGTLEQITYPFDKTKNAPIPLDIDGVFVLKDVGVSTIGENTITYKISFLDEGPVDGTLFLHAVEVVIKPPGEDSPSYVDLIPAEKLKVAKMEKSLDADGLLDPDKDIDRFYVRIVGGDGLLQFGKVSVNLSTRENPLPAYDDPASLVKTEKRLTDLYSESQLMVSDTFDDEYMGANVGEDNTADNDRTNLVQLDGKLRVESIKVANKLADSFNLDVPVPSEHELKADLLLLGTAADWNGKLTDIEGWKRTTEERYAQIALKPTFNQDFLPEPNGVDSGFFDYHDRRVDDLRLPREDGTKTVDAARLAGYDSSVLVVVVLDFIDDEVSGRAFTPLVDYGEYNDVVFLNYDQIKMTPKPFTMPHEIGHLLTNNFHYGDDYPIEPATLEHLLLHNLMRKVTSEDLEIEASKRLFNLQEEMLRNELFESNDE